MTGNWQVQYPDGTSISDHPSREEAVEEAARLSEDWQTPLNVKETTR